MRQRSSLQKAMSTRRLMQSPSVENFLRYYEDVTDNGADLSAGCWYLQQASDGQMIRPNRSVSNLMRCLSEEHLHVGSTDTSPRQSEEEEARLRCYKHLELCSWFSMINGRPGQDACKDHNQIRRGNLEEWVLSYFFDGAEDAGRLTAEERREMTQLVNEIVAWASLTCEPGKNSALKCYRLRNDPFPAVHRPLCMYGLTAFFLPSVGNRYLTWLGFRPYRSGSMEYWFRPASPDEDWFRSSSPLRPHKLPQDQLPLVFCHGVGVGPSMCLSFLQILVQNLGHESPIFLVDTAGISMRFADDVPCAREVSANMVNMLEVWCCRGAHFVGHSFGSFLVAWMLRYQRSYLLKCTFIDPVCFLVLKTMRDINYLQQKKSVLSMNTMEMGIRYFVLTELFVCNFVCRCFFWEESNIDFSDLHGIDSLVILEAEDKIVPTHSVRLLAVEEQERRQRSSSNAMSRSGACKLMWLDGQPHAGFLADTGANQWVNEGLGLFHRTNGLRNLRPYM
eukprot:TRINITY_DN12981_c0_g1_i1.p1 TRINITY_DN12981_c0_g1~~TRINITY_DN12981_c0_g1_i1.p1  ORF type:complete len:506 (+),score=53.98 TRINITY_DN12981_c0_g1_i1:707-2224(+)